MYILMDKRSMCVRLICSIIVAGQIECSTPAMQGPKSNTSTWVKTLFSHPMTQLAICTGLCWYGYCKYTAYQKLNSKKEETKTQLHYADCFELVKSLVKSSKFHIEDWDTYIANTKYVNESTMPRIDNPEIRKTECTECSEAAAYIIYLFTGLQDVTQRHNSLTLQKWEEKSAPLLSNEYWGTWGNFFQKTATSYTCNIAQQLLSESEHPEHALFYISSGGGAHVFVIEKLNDGSKTFWRIYQSWYTTYTLAQWLGIAPWRMSADDSPTALFNAYGKGAKLNKEQMTYFIEHFLHIETKISPSVLTYVRMFNVTPAAYSGMKARAAIG